MSEILILITGILVVVATLGYPLTMRLLARIFACEQKAKEMLDWPLVTVLISARNEAGVMAAKLQNTLNLDYPADALEVIVVSDGSTDGTVAEVEQFKDRGVRVVALESPAGKTMAAAHGVAEARGDILVFTDATGMLSSNTLKDLVSAFSDPGVGCATGRVVYTEGQGGVASGMGIKGRWDAALRHAESRMGTGVMVSGSIHAVRREAFLGVPSGVSYDLALPFLVATRGERTVYVPEAVSQEAPRRAWQQEWTARVRIGMRSYAFFFYFLRRVYRVRSFGYLVRILGHKMSRWLAAPALVVLAVATAFALPESELAWVAATGQGVVYGLALLGAMGVRFPGGSSALLFVTVNAAFLVSFGRVLLGGRAVIWNPDRSG